MNLLELKRSLPPLYENIDMKKIDTWLDIQKYVSEAARTPLLPRETSEFTRVEISEIASVREVHGHVSSICVA